MLGRKDVYAEQLKAEYGETVQRLGWAYAADEAWPGFRAWLSENLERRMMPPGVNERQVTLMRAIYVNGHTQSSVARVVGLTRQRISQLHEDGLWRFIIAYCEQIPLLPQPEIDRDGYERKFRDVYPELVRREGLIAAADREHPGFRKWLRRQLESGARPAQLPDELVDLLKAEILDGKTRVELGQELGMSRREVQILSEDAMWRCLDAYRTVLARQVAVTT